ncbi:MAG: NAD(P)/FAD-dependent oxidoreductase [Acidobacteriaceae bacterium]|nr:NAD(P)/FAD-dependent oxidoreductase [Acidobacteriaceae bacterium]
MRGSCPHLDKGLETGGRISRRDFLDGALLASGGLLLSASAPAQSMLQESEWTGYTGEGDYRLSAGNMESVVQSAHSVRDGKYDSPPSAVIDTGEFVDCVIVGGGFAGLSAALFFSQKAGSGATCIVLDNAAVFGGVAKRNEFEVDGHRLYAPQASVHFQPPYPHSFLKSVYDSFGMDFNAFKEYQTWQGPSPSIDLTRSPYRVLEMDRKTYGFYFGAKFGKSPGVWVVDPWGKNLEGCPFPDAQRQELLAWRQGKRAEPAWVYEYPGDEVSRRIDSITMEEYYIRTLGLSRESVRLLYTKDTAGGLGLGPDALSGFCVYAWSSIPTTDDSAETGWNMFPGGNSGMNRMIVKTLIPEAIDGPRSMAAVWKNPINFQALDQPGQRTRIRLRSTVVRVEHNAEPTKSEFVWITYSRDGKLYRLKAKTAVMAGGGWMTKHVVRDLDAERREAYSHFLYSPYMVANVAVRNWRFLYKLGISGGQWFEGFGGWVEVRKMAKFGVDTPYAGPDLPTVLTFFIDFTKPGLPAAEQGHVGRTELLSTPYREYERRIREQMTEMFGASGFDANRDIAGIVLNRWGHAFVNPQPGFFFGTNGKPAPRDALRNAPFGRIAFSHSDLAGAMDHRNAFMESNRAVGQLLNQVFV